MTPRSQVLAILILIATVAAGAAELIAPVQAIVPKPATLDWAQASGLMVTGATAWHALTVTDVHEGDTVLINAAAGGVGLMAVQLAAILAGERDVRGSEEIEVFPLIHLGNPPSSRKSSGAAGHAPHR